MARQTKRTKRRDDIFFAVYGTSGSVTTAAEAANYSKSAVYRYLKEDEDFANRFQLAKVETLDLIKGSAIDLAVNGDETYKVLNLINPDTGKKMTRVVKERRRSSSMIQFLVERMSPSEFDKEVKREKRHKAEAESEEDWSHDRDDQLMNDFLDYLVDYKLGSIPTEDLEQRIQGMQQELEKREKEE